jgi:hypothetical protein
MLLHTLKGQDFEQNFYLKYPILITAYWHGTSRVADPDPDWIRIQSGQRIRIRIRNPDPDSESGSGSRMAKMTHKSRKKL